MSNVLSEAEKQNVIATGRLGWSLRRIEQEIGVRRETASAYLKAAGIPVSRPGRRKHRVGAKPAISANQVTTDLDGGKTGHFDRAGDHRLYRLPSDELVRACSSNGFCSLPGGGYFHDAFYGFLERRHRGREGETDELFAGRTKGGSGNCGDAGVLKQDAA
jgi:hypothetical protein